MRQTTINPSDLAAFTGAQVFNAAIRLKGEIDSAPDHPCIGQQWSIGKRAAQGARFLSTVRVEMADDGSIAVVVDDAWTEGRVVAGLAALGVHVTFADVPPPDDSDSSGGNG